ncbi:MAG TPA: hypothetical protein VFY32_10460 [Solirubrobacteraceae bacterium]|nr:hypothetical protein [Solirubrobacteraceae bacterium]
MLAAALRGEDHVYILMSEEAYREPVHGDGLQVLRHGSDAAAVVVAVGPTLDQTLAATLGLDVTVAYLATVRPFAPADESSPSQKSSAWTRVV